MSCRMTGTYVCLWIFGDSHTSWGGRRSSRKCRKHQIPRQGVNQVLPGDMLALLPQLILQIKVGHHPVADASPVPELIHSLVLMPWSPRGPQHSTRTHPNTTSVETHPRELPDPSTSQAMRQHRISKATFGSQWPH